MARGLPMHPRRTRLGLIEGNQLVCYQNLDELRIRGARASASLKGRTVNEPSARFRFADFRLLFSGFIRGARASASLKGLGFCVCRDVVEDGALQLLASEAHVCLGLIEGGAL